MSSGSSDTDRLFEEIRNAAFRSNEVGEGSAEKKTEKNLFRRSVPNYRMIEEIHRGGQGVVFKAIQESTNRTVAIKFILQGSFATERQRFRFEREVDLASRLNHRNIVTIYDSGVCEQQPFCAMEYVDGEPLRVDHRSESPSRQSIRDTITTFAKVCEAVGYAHQRGVIHRDLKPANILVDHQGEPHVLDFGLAKVVDEETIAGYSPRTLTGEFVGTLAYASPEQAQASPELVDTRSDVYSLGVVLYELLTGKLPYDVSGTIAETLNKIHSEDPIRPSKMASRIDEDVETILLKALSKDPERRYQNASLLANDLRRYLDGDPIDARRDSHWYLFRKLVSRHRRAAFASIGFLVTLVIALIAISIFYFQAASDRDVAERSQKNEESQRKHAVRKAAEADLAKDDAEFKAYQSRIAAADASIRVYDTMDAIRNLSAVPQGDRNLEWYLLLNRADQSRMTSGALDGFVPMVRYSVDQKTIIACIQGGNLKILDAHDLKIVKVIELPSPPVHFALHPDGKRAAVGLKSGVVAWVDLDLGTVLHKLKTGDQPANQVVLSGDGKLLAASCGWDPSVPGFTRVWNTENWKPLHQFEGHPGPHFALAINIDATLLATAGSEIRIWNLATGELVKRLEGHGDWVNSLSFSPQGKWLVSGANDGLIKVWSIKNGRLLRNVYGHLGFVNSVQYSRDGRRILSTSSDRTIRIWNAWSWTPERVIWGSMSAVHFAEFDQAEHQIVSTENGAVKLWDVRLSLEKQLRLADFSSLQQVDFGTDHRHLVTASNSGFVKWWTLGETPSIDILANEECIVSCVALSSKNQWAAWGTENGDVRLWNSDTRKTIRLANHEGFVTGVRFFEAGKKLLTSGKDGKIHVFDLNRISEKPTVYEYDQPVHGIDIAPGDAAYVAVHDDHAAIRDLQSNRVLQSWAREKVPFEMGRAPVRFHPSGSTVALTSGISSIEIREAKTGRLLESLRDHADGIQSIAFSSDGSRLLTSARDGKTRFWDTDRYEVVYSIRDLLGYGNSVAVSQDGKRIAVGMFNGQLKIWDTSNSTKQPAKD